MENTQVNLNVEELKSFLNHIVKNNNFLQENGKTPTAVNIEGGAGIGKTSSVLQLARELDYNFIRLNLATIEELGDLIGFPVRQFQLCKTTSEGQSIDRVIQVSKEIYETVSVPTMVKKMITTNKPIQKQVMGADGKFIMRTVTVPVQSEVEVEEMVEQQVLKTVMVDEIVQESVGESYECLWIDENATSEYIKRGYEFTGEKRMAYCPPEWIAGIEDKPGFLILDDYSRADQRFIQACMTLN